jgi:hypothetical protein
MINGGSSNSLFLSINTNYLYGDVNGVVVLAANNNFRLNTNGSERIRIDSSGNVGIGTTSPGYKLEINSGTTNVTSAFKSTDNQAWISIQDDDSGTYGALIGTDTDAGNDFVIANQSAQKTFVINSGNVGIGTTSPGSKLEVAGGADSIVKVLGTTTAARLDLQTNSYHKFIQTIESDGRFRLYNQTTSSEQLTVLNNGNVGINTTSPEEKLHVIGSALISNNEFYKVENTTGTNYKIAGLTNGNVIQIGAIDYTSAGTIFAGGDNISITTGGASGSTRMKIDSSGNVGVGISNPNKKFVVKSPGADNGIFLLKNSTSGIIANIIETGSGDGALLLATNAAATSVLLRGSGNNYINSGNVGIGTTSPGTKLVIEGTNDAAGTGVVEIKTTGTNLKIGGNTTYSWIQSHASKPLYINQLGNNVILNSGGGRVGIGTTSPTQKLHVVGNARVTGAYYDSNNSPGTANQVLISTVSGTDWVDGSAIPGVPAGSGTLNTVAMWTPDGDTLGDSPITISGNNSTFAGNVLALSYLAGQSSQYNPTGGGTTLATLTNNSASRTNLVISNQTNNAAASAALVLATYGHDYFIKGSSSLGGSQLTLGFNTSNFLTLTSSAATFAGDVTATANYTAGNSKIIYKAQRSGGAVAGDWSYDDATTDMSLGTSTAHSFSLKTGNTRALTIDTSQNATFAGDVTLSAAGSTGEIIRTTDNTEPYFALQRNSGSNGVGVLRLLDGGDLTFDAGATGAGQTTRLTIDGATGNATFAGAVSGTTATFTTFSGDLNGTINTATTAVTQVDAVDNETVATTAYVNNKIALIPAGLVFQGTWNAATNTPTLTSGSGTTGNFYIVSTPGSTN